jgi:NAD(P)-dependent dehydrogenase (short-subunit alcohol dehydrogenase family)
MKSTRTALITGASSGFGLLTTITLARRGWRVLATMRDLTRRTLLEDAARAASIPAGQIEIHQLDVTNSAQIAAIAALVDQRPDPLHALINNAGFALPGFAEDTTDAELRRQLDTNFFGAVDVTRGFLPQLRRQGFGHIVMLSSISGRLGFPGVGSYAAAKFALEGWTESLRYELKSVGIQVALVEPGAFDTDIWTRNAQLSAGFSNPDSPNAARVARWRQRVEAGRPKANPQVVADTIVRILDTPKPKLRYPVGTDAKMGLLFSKLLPESLWERIVLKNTGLDT